MTKCARQGPRFTEVASKSSSVNTDECGNLVADEERFERLFTSPVRRHVGQVTHHDASTPRVHRFIIECCHAVVSNVGIGEGNDLTGVTRVGNHFLVPT